MRLLVAAADPLKLWLSVPEALALGLPDAWPLPELQPDVLMLTRELWLWVKEAEKEALREAERESAPELL